SAPLHRLFHPRVRHNQPSAVEHIMRHPVIDKIDDLGFELGRFGLELGERLREPVGDFDLTAAKFAHQLDVVVSGNAERRAGLDQRHHDAQHARRVRTAINEIAEKHSLAAVRMTQLSKIVAQAGQQGFELGTATVNVADNIEWPRILTAIAPERLPFHGGRFNLFGRMQYGYMPEPLAIESTNG